MPDLTIIYVQQCKSFSQHEMMIGKHRVIFAMGKAHCDCADYKYRKGPVGGKCKHIVEAESKRCLWHSQFGKAQTKRQENNRICPVCGGETEIVRFGV